jgi:hypothetical protein
MRAALLFTFVVLTSVHAAAQLPYFPAPTPEVPPAIVKEAVAIRPITRDATGVWHATRDIAMYRD